MKGFTITTNAKRWRTATTVWCLAAGLTVAVALYVALRMRGGNECAPLAQKDTGVQNQTNIPGRGTVHTTSSTPAPRMAAPERHACAASTIATNVAQYERLHALLRSPGITDEMTGAERARRQLYFNAYNKVELIGPTGSPYDAPLYCALTNPILSQADIDLLIATTPGLDDLLTLAHSIASGDGMMRDVHAAEKLYEYIMAEARRQGDMETYATSIVNLGEHRMLPIGMSDAVRSVALFEQLNALCEAHDNKTFDVDDALKKDYYHWSLICLAYCHEQRGETEAAEAAYAKVTQLSTRHEDVGTQFARIVNKARAMVAPQPQHLVALAEQLEAVGQRYQQAHADENLPFLETITGQARSFRRRAQILSSQKK